LGREFYFFENKDIRSAANNIAKLTQTLFMGLTCTLMPRRKLSLFLYQDVNGDFVPTNINSTNPEIEADYLWVYFTLSAPTFRLKEIFILAECLIITA
jgi:hypothetical protein